MALSILFGFHKRTMKTHHGKVFNIYAFIYRFYTIFKAILYIFNDFIPFLSFF